jgi:hypothetical protein
MVLDLGRAKFCCCFHGLGAKLIELQITGNMHCWADDLILAVFWNVRCDNSMAGTTEADLFAVSTRPLDLEQIIYESL